MELQMALSLFAKYMIQLSSQQTKVQFDEELQALISILNTMTSSSGLKLENLKVTLTDNLLTCISVLSLVISLCESYKQEILKQEQSGQSLSKNVKQLENLIFYSKEIQTKIIQKHIKKIV